MTRARIGGPAAIRNERRAAAWNRLLEAIIAADAAPPCETDPELWFEPEHAELAEALCAACPLLEPCGEYGDAARVRHGVWGGVSRYCRHCGDTQTCSHRRHRYQPTRKEQSA